MRAWNSPAALLLSASMAFAGTTSSLWTVLTPDGEIMEGASGSFDPAGFRMEYGPDGEPLFVEDDSSPLEPVLPPAGQDLDGTWYPLGSGMDQEVRAIDYSDTGILYVGGNFTQAGGVVTNHIASWNGTSWSGLGSGLDGAVFAIAVSGSDVYVGGYFTEAGGNSANNVARWSGSSWSALGSGVNDMVWAITVSGSDVYVGGWFTEAGGNPANHIARWNGSSWSALGSGTNSQVNAIAASDSDVYAGGWFTEAGGNPANRIARWDGSSWSALGSGVNGPVMDVTMSGSDVYAGGEFHSAGGISVNHIARWEPDSTGIEPSPEMESSVLHASPNPTASGIELSFQSIGISPLTFEVYDAAGRLVRTQDLGTLPSGSQAHYWDGLDGNGSALAQGVYFLRLSSTDIEASTRVVLLR